jgi:aryl-phospho-beta-D-glucosidase BglC (GH1 family)
MLYGRGITMDKQKRNEALANDLKKFIEKNQFIDTRIYFNNKCYDFKSDGSMEILEDIKGSSFFEYANDDTVSMSFEGTLNHILNGYHYMPKTQREFDKIFAKHNCYYEFGYAWSLSVYEN